ncbi:DUF6571 family protein [Sphaerisporangium sp. TRM90804]|uniref:DUF6571 family protein n=1 Tax=Sphaerisporangium sp. TRM90804 TaxID=3031113 RepID=UPI00244C2487|nr:DUF6571 family protein [Sphaerisporangium sp. TRM90804]MDH2424176.1 hypothetical protein [Sphaerisporangium sp. TRM90804]
MTTVPPGTGPLSPDFTGIDPDLMDTLISEMSRARGVIGERTEAIRRLFAANGVPATSLAPIGEVERWIDEHLPDLRRRNDVARRTAALPTWSPAALGALTSYDETALLPATEAQRLGRQLAAEYKRLDPDAIWNSGLKERYQAIVEKLAAHANDPAFTTAFYAALGLEGTLQLPVMLRQNLGPPGEATLAAPRPDDEVIGAASHAFATAVSASSPAPGFSAIKDALTGPALSGPQRFGMSLLLSAGAFPTEWLSQAVLARGLAEPRKVNPGFLYALGNNPAAARLAISAVTSGDQAKLTHFIKELSSRTTHPYATDGEADAFGRMLAAISGAYDEKDGEHSKQAAMYAFTVMTVINDLEVAAATRVHLAEIAGAYATEIAEGADLGDENQLLPSAFGDVNSSIPGLKPAFRLSPEDTYRFIKTFADGEANQLPFTEGMGNLTRRLVAEGVPAMLKEEDTTRLDEVFAALGNVRGLQLAAEETIATAKDEATERTGKMFSWGSGNALGVVGLVVPPAGALAWTTLGAVWSTADTLKPEKKKEADKVEEFDDLETLGRRHAIAQLLMDGGFSPNVPAHDYQSSSHPRNLIATQNGKLRPFPEIAQDSDALRSFESWLIENGLGKAKRSFASIADDFAANFDGHKSHARARSTHFKQ